MMAAAEIAPALALRGSAVARAREGLARWRREPLSSRLAFVKRLRHRLADGSESLSRELCGARPAAEFLAAQLIPLLDACRFLEKNAQRLLKPRLHRSSPLWLFGVAHVIRREPAGVVLVIGPSNYPFFLPGVQALQGLTAGNTVLLKPGTGGSASARRLAALCYECGLPRDALIVLDETVSSAREAIDEGVDKVFLTGSAETGESVLEQLAPRLTPSAMELSGCDAVFILPDADLDLAARCVAYGLRLNSGRTCIAPRRVIVWSEVSNAFQEKLLAAAEREVRLVNDLAACEFGGRNLHLVRVVGLTDAITEYERSSYRLGASIFTASSALATHLAAEIDAGSICVNDLIVPTADGRVPFGGRGRSGFGVTRGPEGLLEMTCVKVISRRNGSFRPHLRRPSDGDFTLLSRMARITYGSWAARCKAVLNKKQS